MKTAKTIFAAALWLAALSGMALSAKPEDAIMRLINSKTSGSPASYAHAVAEVAEMAETGKPGNPRREVARLLIAVTSRDSDAPAAARIGAEKRLEYLDSSTNAIMRLAKELNNGMAWYLLAMESGDTNMLVRAVKLGNPQALNAWGTLLLTSTLADARNGDEAEAAMTQALDCFRKAAGKDDANGMYNLGMCLSRGLGIEPDRESAFNCFRSAAEMNHPEAINNIGYYFHEGLVVPKDIPLSTRWYKKSSDLKNPYGMFNYALAVRKGEGTEKDPAAAAILLRESAKAGCVEAMDVLGEMLLAGEGVEKNEKAAFMQFRRAATYGYWHAMENLAACYEKGAGVQADGTKAMRWRIRSRASRGDRNAQRWLAEHDTVDNALKGR